MNTRIPMRSYSSLKITFLFKKKNKHKPNTTVALSSPKIFDWIYHRASFSLPHHRQNLTRSAHRPRHNPITTGEIFSPSPATKTHRQNIGRSPMRHGTNKTKPTLFHFSDPVGNASGDHRLPHPSPLESSTRATMITGKTERRRTQCR